MAGYLDDTRKVGDARGYLVFTGTSDGRPVTVATSGVGSPSTAIAVEELAACGARTFIRVGSCASITERLPVGGIMVATAAVCDEGTSRYYAPPNFPPVASLTVVNALVDAASALEVPVELGMTRSTDSFYQGERLTSIVERWRQLGVLTFEMETSCLFTVAATLGLEAASIVCVGSNLLTGDATYQGHGLDAFAAGQQSMLRVAIAAASSLAART
jgi:uridine phosphorylase